MTPLSLTAQHSRKDVETLISHQLNAPCGHGGYGAESVMAFLMQLYAYFCTTFNEETASLNGLNKVSDGTDALKEHLMCSGPYRVVIYRTDFRARPNALRLRQRPAIYNGPSMGSWIILWPGAVRDTYFKTGQVISALERRLSKCRADGAPAISAVGAMVRISGHRYGASTPLIFAHPIRLIPP